LGFLLEMLGLLGEALLLGLLLVGLAEVFSEAVSGSQRLRLLLWLRLRRRVRAAFAMRRRVLAATPARRDDRGRSLAARRRAQARLRLLFRRRRARIEKPVRGDRVHVVLQPRGLVFRPGVRRLELAHHGLVD